MGHVILPLGHVCLMSTSFSQIFLTSPNFYDGHKLSEVTLGFSFFPRAKLPDFNAISQLISPFFACFVLLPTFLGGVHYFSWLLPTVFGDVSPIMGEVILFHDFSQFIWEMSYQCWEKSLQLGRSHVFPNDRKCTKLIYPWLLPTELGEVMTSHNFYR